MEALKDKAALIALIVDRVKKSWSDISGACKQKD